MGELAVLAVLLAMWGYGLYLFSQSTPADDSGPWSMLLLLAFYGSLMLYIYKTPDVVYIPDYDYHWGQ